MSEEIHKTLMSSVNSAIAAAIQIAVSNGAQKFDMKATLESGAETNVTCFVTSGGDVSLYVVADVSGAFGKEEDSHE